MTTSVGLRLMLCSPYSVQGSLRGRRAEVTAAAGRHLAQPVGGLVQLAEAGVAVGAGAELGRTQLIDVVQRAAAERREADSYNFV